MSTQDSCPTDLSIFDYTLSWVLILGTIVSYLPQHLKIHEEKSHAGLSFATLSLSNQFAFGSVMNYLALSIPSTFFCCGPGISFVDCSGAVLAFIQLFFNYLCQHIVLLLFMIHYDHEYALNLEQQNEISVDPNVRRHSLNNTYPTIPFTGNTYSNGNKKIQSQHYQRSVKLCWVQFTFEWFTICILVVLIYSVGVDSNTLYIFGVIMMGFTSILACLSIVPQIIETYHHKGWGSLSALMVLIQAFGALLVGVNLAPHGSWDLWTPYIVNSFMLFVLLVLGLYYSFRDRWAPRKTIEEGLLNSADQET